jgi:hypothetical protein
MMKKGGKIMYRKIALLIVVLILGLLAISFSGAADPGDGDSDDVAPCCRDTGAGFSILELIVIVGGIVAFVVILYLILDRQKLMRKLE